MQFDSSQHQDQFAPIVGQQRFRINTVSQTMTQSGFPVLVMEMQIIEGSARNRRHTERFLLEHDNPETVKIAMGKLSSLSRAVGLPKWDDERQLEGQVGDAMFGPQKNSPEYAEIKRYIVPSDVKGASASNPHRDVNARNGQLQESIARLPDGRPTAPPADDDDLPF